MTDLSADQRRRLTELADRAKANLEFIERYVALHPNPTGVFEVTQLLASLLWLVVAADQWLEIDDQRLEELHQHGWPQLQFSGQEIPTTLRKLTKFLRNAVAHVNLDVLGDGDNITGMKLWNQRRVRLGEPHTADLIISVKDLRRLADLLPVQYGLIGSNRPLRIRRDRLGSRTALRDDGFLD